MSDDWSEWDSGVIEEVLVSTNIVSQNETNHQKFEINEKLDTEEEISENDPLIKYTGAKATRHTTSDSTEDESSDASSDDIPLIKLKQMNTCTTAYMSSTSESDDDNADPDFSLGSEEMDTDSSDSEISTSHIIIDHPDADVQKACEITACENELFTIAVKWHTKRLNTMLDSRGLKTVTVPANGDCFFSSVLILRPDIPFTVHEFRHQVANHLSDNRKHYTGFLSTNACSKRFQERVNQIMHPGNWSDDIADLLPLAVANMINQPITILTSRHSRQVIEINPTMSKPETEPITLAYSCIPGREHYDPCIPVKISARSKVCDKEFQTTPTESSFHSQSSPENKQRQSTTPQKNPDQYSTTPRKSASYISPHLKKKTRKRISKPENWKRNVRKQLRLKGKSYMNKNGSAVPGKSLLHNDCSKCRYKCDTCVTEENRTSLFHSFWQLGTYERQRDYIASCIEEKDTKTKKSRTVSRLYTFLVDGVRVRVCKGFFLRTLNISEKKMRVALKARQTGELSKRDKRGRSSSVNKTPKGKLEGVKQHIESFPTVDSHYSRKNTRRRYLTHDLSISKMYSLYTEGCNLKNEKPVSEYIYRTVFNTKYNLYFFKPKKDQCQLCHRYQQMAAAGTVEDAIQQQYQQHQRRKDEARAEKEVTKENAKKHPEIYAATFDLQAVLGTPCSLVSQVYYKRKLSTYNLSFYSLGDQSGTCYMWNESHGKRGSCEIATCFLKHIQSLPSQVKYVTFFSDSCTGQNRNKYVASALHYAITTIPNVQVIEQKFLEPGHTQMECDSMHAAIEITKRKTSVYEPSQWDTIVQMARKQKPYCVVPMHFSEFLDFHEYADTTLKNLVYDSTGKKINWLRIKVLQVRREAPGFMFVKYDFSGEFINMCTNRRKQRGRPSIGSTTPLFHPRRKYNNKLPVSNKKKNDLLSLCRSGVIPEVHHNFYENLPSSSNVKDTVPNSDQENSD